MRNHWISKVDVFRVVCKDTKMLVITIRRDSFKDGFVFDGPWKCFHLIKDKMTQREWRKSEEARLLSQQEAQRKRTQG